MFAFCFLSCWPLSFGMLVLVSYTNGVFRLSLLLLSLKLSRYLVRILYFVVICMTIRLHQSNQAHSIIWQDSLNCKYQNVKIIHCSEKVRTWTLIRLHQSNQVYSTTWQVLLICKYQIHSIFHVVTYKTWICFVNIPFNIQRFYVRCDYEKRV